MILGPDALRIPVTARHVDDLDCAADLEYVLYQPAGAQGGIIRVRRKNQEARVGGKHLL